MRLDRNTDVDDLIIYLKLLETKSNRANQISSGVALRKWVSTPVANLVRYKPSGTYFARVRIRGKLFLQSLKTEVMTVAKLRLVDFIKDKQEEMGMIRRRALAR